MVVMDRKDYIQKATNLLAQPVHRTNNRNPTNKLKAKLITLLSKMKRETGLEDDICKYMYPWDALPPSFMGFLRSIKPTLPSGL